MEGDIVGAAKVVNDFVRTSRILTVKGGVLENAVISAADVEAVASLPSREELYGKIVGMLASPMSHGWCAQRTEPSIAYVINARNEQLAATAAD